MIATGKPDYTSLDLPPAPPDRPYVLVNMVTSIDGKATIDGTEQGLGSTTDQRLMRELRTSADLVISGASTLRATGTSSRVRDDDLIALREQRGQTPHPIAATLSASGDLPLEKLFFTARDFEAVIYVTDATSEARREAIEATGRRAVVLSGDIVTEMLAHMRRELGVAVVLIEGGPTLNGDLFERGLVDDFFLTLGPVVVGGDVTLSAVRGAHTPTLDSATRLELVSAFNNSETSELYLRYRTQGFGVTGH
jgi:riboflavin biosynthesis pyrimidine reductase